MWRRGLILVTILSAFLYGTPALAELYCARHADLLTQLATRFGETPHSIGFTDQGALLEVLVSPTGSWTIIVTAPTGPSCIVATGKEWETVVTAKEEPGV